MKLTLHQAIELAIDSGIKTHRMLGMSNRYAPFTTVEYALVPNDIWNQIIFAYQEEIREEDNGMHR